MTVLLKITLLLKERGPNYGCHSNQGETHAELDLDTDEVTFSLSLFKGNTTGHFLVGGKHGLGEEEGREGRQKGPGLAKGHRPGLAVLLNPFFSVSKTSKNRGSIQ